jgi:threonine/homoserine/homoserine lactone efflux protein
MHSLMAAAGFITAAAVTPGPNNLLVMRAAADGGTTRALPAIAAILLGSLVLLALVGAGGGAMFERYPVVRTTATIAGALYLGWLGLRIVLSAGQAAAGEARNRAGLPVSAPGVFALQFLNPKGWVMVLTAVGGAQADMSAIAAIAWLAPLFVVILTTCLLLWALCGARLAKSLARPRFRLWFDRSMGGLLVACAILLFL